MIISFFFVCRVASSSSRTRGLHDSSTVTTRQTEETKSFKQPDLFVATIKNTHAITLARLLRLCPTYSAQINYQPTSVKPPEHTGQFCLLPFTTNQG